MEIKFIRSIEQVNEIIEFLTVRLVKKMTTFQIENSF